MRTHVAGRVRVNDVLAFRNLSFLSGFADDLGDIVADRLRKTSGVDGNNLWVVDREDGLERLQQALPGRRRPTSLP